jgi:hypothetical protein
MNAKTKSNPNETCETIKLGIEAHAKWYYVGRQIDGATPQPVQKMTSEWLLRFVAAKATPSPTRAAATSASWRSAKTTPLSHGMNRPRFQGFVDLGRFFAPYGLDMALRAGQKPP